MQSRRAVAWSALAALAAPALLARRAGAATWPDRTVRLIVPFTPGGANDVVARILAGGLAEIWGRELVVDNKGGAGGNIGYADAARAAPDGHTLLFGPTGVVLNTFIYAAPGYDVVADFAPVSLVCELANILVATNALPVATVREFIDYARAHKGEVSYASAGLGTTLHLCGELFNRMAGVDLVHVPYKGTGQAFADLIPGRVHVMFNALASVTPQIRGGQLRALGVTTSTRARALPNVPTIAEAGVPGYDVSSWFGVFAPKRTPPDVVAAANAAIVKALALPAVKAALEDTGAEVMSSTQAELGDRVSRDLAKWGPVIKAAGIRQD
jgi:tripartite-type tricarboxylate transporter receptor subunit TctC